MEYASGNVFIRTQPPLKKGEGVLGHRHNFDHTTYCTRGTLEVTLLSGAETDAAGRPLKAQIERVVTIRAGDEHCWLLIAKGRFHILKALEEDTRYHCIYSHRIPQALRLDEPGRAESIEYSRRDADGTLWLRADEKVVQAATGWREAYA